MANEKNLKSLSTNEARALGQKGGVQSGIARKNKKLMKENFEMLMSLELQDNKIKSQIKALGLADDEITLQMACCVEVMQQALHGNIKAFKIMRDTLGQNPKDGTEIEERETIVFVNDIEYMLSLQEGKEDITK